MSDQNERNLEHLGTDQDDDKPAAEKLEILKSRFAATDVTQSAVDLVCGVCRTRCCSPCTANGDWHHCSKTMFTNCSVCGHASNQHYAAGH